MKKDQYLKLEVSLLHLDGVSRLIDRMGMEGLGLYVALLLKMRQDDDLQASCSPASLAAMARWCNSTPERLREVIEDFELFVPHDQSPESISSPYLNRVMAALWTHRGDRVPTVKHPSAVTVKRPSAVTVKRGADGRFTAPPTIEEESRVKEEKSTSLTREASQGVREVLSFDATIASLCQQQAWREEMAMKSGQSQLFMQHFAWLVDEFVRFLRLRGEEGTILDVNDAKRRFYYWMIGKQGHQSMEVLKNPERGGEENLYRFETLIDQRRTYLGRPIPNDAPPRPDSYAVWDEESQQWHR